MAEITAKQRYLDMFAGKKIDRIPVCPRVFENVVFEHVGTKDIEDCYMERMIDYYRHYGFDIIDWNCTPRPHFDMVDFVLEGPGWKPETTTEEKGKTVREIQTVTTPKGQLRRTKSTTVISEWETESALIEYPIKSEKDFDLIAEFMPPPYELDVTSIKQANEFIGEDGLATPAFHSPFNLLGYCYRTLDNLLMDVSVNPDFYHRMMEYSLDRIKNYTQQVINADVLMMDIATNMANGIVVSPNFLVEHILPYENRLADFIQDQGVACLYHNCGHAAKHLDVYDKLHHKLWGYLAPKPHGDVILEEAIAKVPKEMILWGHVDQIDFLRQATPAQIEERVKYICETIKPRGNYILGTTDYLEINTPPENIRAFVEAGLKYGSYEN